MITKARPRISARFRGPEIGKYRLELQFQLQDRSRSLRVIGFGKCEARSGSAGFVGRGGRFRGF